MPTMKAAVVRSFGSPLAIEDVPVPQPGPGKVFVKVKACGVCHTDLHAASGDWPVKPVPPFIPGHEAAGIVAALGSGVSGLTIGDTVGVAWMHDACLRCDIARPDGKRCASINNTGYSINGGFAEYVIASAAFAARHRNRFREDCADSVRGS
jgi:propanol-preferring alcohol dehydrogenase